MSAMGNPHDDKANLPLRVYFTPRPIFCQECGGRFPDVIGTEMFDCATKHGPWGCFCVDCWPEVRKHEALGLGKGQRYRIEGPDMKFWQVEGAPHNTAS